MTSPKAEKRRRFREYQRLASCADELKEMMVDAWAKLTPRQRLLLSRKTTTVADAVSKARYGDVIYVQPGHSERINRESLGK